MCNLKVSPEVYAKYMVYNRNNKVQLVVMEKGNAQNAAAFTLVSQQISKAH
jgi:hypothetical protein